jgi:predicted anti-sigma-YlaC factor YlaD
MGEVMNHLTDEQLTEHYLGEGANRVVVETHLRICSRCEQVYEEITNVLEVRAPEPPAREPGYGRRVWQSIQAPLRPYPVTRRNYFSWPRIAFAGACLLGLIAAFLVGALWQRSRVYPSEATISPQAKERVVLFILDDHLDRSERLLVQLNHAAGEKGDPDDSLQTEARQLLPDNRLSRQAISASHDPIMTAALDHLERVLLEVANSPDKLNSADITRIEHEMNTDSLLFQIRVLRARTSRQEPKVDSRKGASI